MELSAGERSSYPLTGSNQMSRHPERAHYEVETVHAILDAGMIAHVAFVADERPQVLPMLYVRCGELLYLHGSTGARLARMAARRQSLAVSVEVTLVDALVLARSTFSHSANYRSVVAHGDARLVRDPARKAEVLEAMVEHLVPGRSADARPPTSDELRQTAVLELGLEDVSAKVRTGGPLDGTDEGVPSCWAGTWPFLVTRGRPEPAEDLGEGIAVPRYLVEGEPVRFSLQT